MMFVRQEPVCTVCTVQKDKSTFQYRYQSNYLNRLTHSYIVMFVRQEPSSAVAGPGGGGGGGRSPPSPHRPPTEEADLAAGRGQRQQRRSEAERSQQTEGVQVRNSPLHVVTYKQS